MLLQQEKRNEWWELQIRASAKRRRDWEVLCGGAVTYLHAVLALPGLWAENYVRFAMISFCHYLVKLQDAHKSSYGNDCQTDGSLHDYNWDPQNNIRNNGGSARSKDTSQKNNGNLVQTRWFACFNRILAVIEMPRRIFIVKNLSAAFTCKFTGPAKMPANLLESCSHGPTQEPCTHIHNQNHI